MPRSTAAKAVIPRPSRIGGQDPISFPGGKLWLLVIVIATVVWILVARIKQNPSRSLVSFRRGEAIARIHDEHERLAPEVSMLHLQDHGVLPQGTTSTGSRHISADLNCSLANQRTCADRLLDSSILIRWNSARHAVFVPADPHP